MPTFNYTQTQGNVQTAPTTYNVQPNNSAARGFENLQNAFMAGMQLKKEMNQSEYERDLKAAQQDIANFEAEWKGASYEQQQEMMAQLEYRYADKYQGDDRWSQQLKTYATNAISGFQGNLNATGLEVEHSNIKMQQDAAYSDFYKRIDDAKTMDEKNALREQLYSQIVAPYEGIETPKAMELASRGLDRINRVDEGLRATAKKRADMRISVDGMASIQMAIEAEGQLTSERRAEIIAQFSRRSDWEDNKYAILDQLDEFALENLKAYYNRPDLVITQEVATEFNTKLQNYLTTAPQAKGKPYTIRAMSHATALQSTVNKQDETNFRALVSNGDVSRKETELAGQTLVKRGIMSKEVFEELMADKDKNLETRNHTTRIGEHIISGNLAALKDEYALHSGVVNTVGKASITQQFSDIEARMGTAAAVDNALIEWKKYKDNSTPLRNIEAIDNVLRMSTDGSIETPEDVNTFITAFEKAKEVGYASKTMSGRVAQNYHIIKTWQSYGIRDIAAKWQSYEDNKQSVSDKDVDKAFANILGMNQWSTTDITPTQVGMLREEMWGSVKRLMQAGIEPKDAVDMFADTIKADYIRASTSFGANSSVLIPRTDDIESEDAYKAVYNQAEMMFEEIKKKSVDYEGVGIGFVGPKLRTEPTGPWMLVTDKGQQIEIPYEDVKRYSEIGR